MKNILGTQLYNQTEVASLNRRKAIHFGGRDKEIYKCTSSFAIVKSEGLPTEDIVIRKKSAILP